MNISLQENGFIKEVFLKRQSLEFRLPRKNQLFCTRNRPRYIG